MTDLALARTFGRSARSYDANAQVQLAVSRSLLAMLPPTPCTGLALDLGAGTVSQARPLAAACPDCRWLALDISLPMLLEAQQRGRLERPWQGVAADAQQLPLPDSSVARIFSSFALQWCDSPASAMTEIARVLQPGGVAAIAVPVAGTLQEFRDSWREVDSSIHFNTLASSADWLQATEDARLQLDQQQTLALLEHYADVRAVAAMLKATGAWHVRRQSAAGLMTPSRYQRLVDAYETRRQTEGLPVSWQVQFLLLSRD